MEKSEKEDAFLRAKLLRDELRSEDTSTERQENRSLGEIRGIVDTVTGSGGVFGGLARAEYSDAGPGDLPYYVVSKFEATSREEDKRIWEDQPAEWEKFASWYEDCVEGIVRGSQQEVLEKLIRELLERPVSSQISPPMALVDGNDNVQLNWRLESERELNVEITPEGAVELVHFKQDGSVEIFDGEIEQILDSVVRSLASRG